jgi:hypothetical protein
LSGAGDWASKHGTNASVATNKLPDTLARRILIF